MKKIILKISSFLIFIILVCQVITANTDIQKNQNIDKIRIEDKIISPEIREIIDRLAAEGKAIILISSELPEILGMSDRVLIMREGQIVGEYNRDDCNEEILGACAISKRI